MRTNLVLNPCFESGVTAGGWATYGSTVAVDTTKWLSGAQSAKVTPNGVTGNPHYRTVVSGLTPGLPFAASYYAYAGTAAVQAHVYLDFRNAAGAIVSTLYSAYVAPSTTSWTRISLTGVIPATATNVTFYARYYGVPAAADTLNVERVLFEQGESGVLPYFDGDVLGCYWTGVAHQSVSINTQLDSTSLRENHVLNPVAATSTAGWSGGGGTGATVTLTNGPVTGCPDALTAFLITWTAASSGGQFGGYYYASVSHAGADGGPWRGSMWARFSWACTAHGALYSYNAAGVNLATHVMPSVAVAANTWTRFFSDDGYTPPVGTDRLLFLVYRDGGGLPGVGDFMNLTAGVIEPAVALLGLDAYGAPPFFSGDTPNSKWLGAANTTRSQTIAVGTNPAFPVVEVESWPGVNPVLTGVPSSQGRFLTDRARGFRISRGRQYELAQDEAASGALTLNNSDGAVTGGVNGCTPVTSARVRATWQGVTYPVWTGQIRSWPQQDDHPALAWAEAELTDTFEALSNHPFGSLIYEEIRSQTSPDAWFPMNEAQSSTSLGNLVPGGVSAPLVNFKLGGVPIAPGATSVFAGSSETVVALANATGTTNRASQYQMVGPQNPGSGYSMPFGAPWGVGIFVRMTAGASVVWSALDTDGSVMACVLVDAGASQVVPYFRQGGPTATYFSTPVSTSTMKTGCYVHVGHDGTNAFVYVYGVYPDGSPYAVTNYGACAITTGSSQWVSWGQAFRSDAIYYSSNADMQMAHGTIWTTSPPAPYTTPLIAIATAGLNAIYSYKSKDVVTYLAAFAGAGVSGDPIDGAVLGQTRDTNKSSALDSIRAATLDYLGRVFMGKDGSLDWLSVHHGMGKPTQWSLGGHAGEQPYTGAPKFNLDPTYVYNDVQVQRPDNRGVAQQASATKAVVRVVDAASQQEFFPRVLQIDSNVRYDADALAVAQYLLARYRQPKTRVQTVKFDASANPALWPFVLGVELGDTVTLSHRALGRADVVLSLSVQKISHEVDAQQGTWITSLELAPWSSDWALGAMHTTVAATVAAAVTSITLAPLPDAAYNPAEASLGVGTTITLSPGTANAETLTIASVVSTPTANTVGYTGITVGFTAATAHPHNAGDVACDPLPSGVTDPTTWDAFSVLDSTTVVSI